VVDVQYRTSVDNSWRSLGADGGTGSDPVPYGGAPLTVEARTVSQGKTAGDRLTSPVSNRSGAAAPATVRIFQGPAVASGGYWIYLDAEGLPTGSATAVFHVNSTCSEKCTVNPTSTSNANTDANGRFQLRNGPGGRSFAGRGSVWASFTLPDGTTIRSADLGGFFTGRLAARSPYDSPTLYDLWSR
jgi:hypothetical protein